MRLNKFVALSTGLSRRKADELIARGSVTINDKQGKLGDQVAGPDTIRLNGKIITQPETTTILFNKPVGCVCSKKGQGSKTVYNLLPEKFRHLKTVGRLDKDSSGLILLTSDGELANRLTHPRYSKTKVYEITLDKPLDAEHVAEIEKGLELEDGLSKLSLKHLGKSADWWQVTMSEGRNRQIRRTFDALGYKVLSLHRTSFGPYELSNGLSEGNWKQILEDLPRD